MKKEYLPIIFAHIGYIIIGLVFTGSTLFMWSIFLANSPQFNEATGTGGKTVEATIYDKKGTTSNNKNKDFYLLVEFPAESELQNVQISVEEKEFRVYNKGDKIQLRYHPSNPTFFVTPNNEQSHLIGKLALGGFLLVALIIALFGILKIYSQIQQKKLENM